MSPRPESLLPELIVSAHLPSGHCQEPPVDAHAESNAAEAQERQYLEAASRLPGLDSKYEQACVERSQLVLTHVMNATESAAIDALMLPVGTKYCDLTFLAPQDELQVLAEDVPQRSQQ